MDCDSPRPTRRSGRTCPRRSRRLAGGGRPWSCPGRLARAADGRTPFTAPRGAACCPYPTMLPKRSARVHGARATPVRVTTGPEVRSRATTRTRKSASSAVMIVAKIRTREFLRSRSLSSVSGRAASDGGGRQPARTRFRTCHFLLQNDEKPSWCRRVVPSNPSCRRPAPVRWSARHSSARQLTPHGGANGGQNERLSAVHSRRLGSGHFYFAPRGSYHGSRRFLPTRRGARARGRGAPDLLDAARAPRAAHARYAATGPSSWRLTADAARRPSAARGAYQRAGRFHTPGTRRGRPAARWCDAGAGRWAPTPPGAARNAPQTDVDGTHNGAPQGGWGPGKGCEVRKRGAG